MKSNILEVAIETQKDGNLYVPCAGITLRGRKDFQRMARHQPDAMTLHNDFPRGVPGTVVKVDLDAKRVWLVEPLRSDEYEPERLKIESAGIRIPYTSEVQGANVADWLHVIARALRDDYAKIVTGEMPKDLGLESKQEVQTDKSEDRIDRLCNLVESLLGKLVSAK